MEEKYLEITETYSVKYSQILKRKIPSILDSSIDEIKRIM